MTGATTSFSVAVDLRNPGQAAACCGLFELSHRLWPGSEAWFDASGFCIAAPEAGRDATVALVIEHVSACDILGLSDEEEQERGILEERKRELRKERAPLPDAEEARRKQLGGRARKGSVTLGPPFNLELDWWINDPSLKTWAGQQEIARIARAAQAALREVPTEALANVFDCSCVMRTSDGKKKVEPFYFDARRCVAHALDIGFSPDVQKVETLAYAAVELFALVGFQRFRPRPIERSFVYRTWSIPLPASVAPAVFCHAVPLATTRGYEFRLRSREDEGRLKAFAFAQPIGG